jgi:SPP1 family predicted phage head-tail adaptor
MQAGNLRHRITIEQRTEVQDPATGNLSETWTPVPGFVRIAGEVLPDRASEFFAAKQIQATMNAMVRMIYQPGVRTDMRVVHHVRPGMDEYWDIQGAVPFQYRQTELRLYCLMREAEGYRRGVDLVNANG